jgi:hypothetical protein
MKSAFVLLAGATALSGIISVANGQARGQAAPRLQASGRAATSVCLSNQCRLTDTSTITVLIEYGQTHARGREVFGTLVPLDTVWRLGANTATHLVTKVPLTIGGRLIPAGRYTLHLRPTATAGQLIVSDTTNVWGIPYVGAARDRARIAMRSRNLADNVESLSIALAPGATPNAGVLTITWGKREFSADWTAQPPAGRAGGARRPGPLQL